jgi:hypothetical protein
MHQQYANAAPARAAVLLPELISFAGCIALPLFNHALVLDLEIVLLNAGSSADVNRNQ